MSKNIFNIAVLALVANVLVWGSVFWTKSVLDDQKTQIIAEIKSHREVVLKKDELFARHIGQIAGVVDSLVAATKCQMPRVLDASYSFQDKEIVDRALRYLDPKLGPVPLVLYGDVPNFEKFLYLNHECWLINNVAVCSACYDHPNKYYGQITVMCPVDDKMCVYSNNVLMNTIAGVDTNQCVKK